MSFADLHQSILRVPPGKWAVGVSGGADSVALLTLLCRRADLTLHVVHLDHELRGEESREDARFVAELAARLGVACSVARRAEIEPTLSDRSTNVEARLRACRHALFRRVVRENALAGVVLAHHLEDQAETVLMRLSRGGWLWTLRSMGLDSRVGDLTILRPLLPHHRARLREWLVSIGQEWREDSSNRSKQFARNRARAAMSATGVDVGQGGELAASLVELAESASRLCAWIDAALAPLPERFLVGELAKLATILARRAGMRWLAAHGCDPAALSTNVLDRFIAMARDAATPSRQHFPGGVLVRRRGGIISVELPRAAARSSRAVPRSFPDA